MKSYTEMSVSEKIAYDFGDMYDKNNIIGDCNHALRRLFRCWLDGSYKGEWHFQQNMQAIENACKNGKSPLENKKLRSFVVGQFVQYIVCDYCQETGNFYEITSDTRKVQRAIKKHCGEFLDSLNDELCIDAYELWLEYSQA